MPLTSQGVIILTVFFVLAGVFAWFRGTRVGVAPAVIIGATFALGSRQPTGDDLDGYLAGLELQYAVMFGLLPLFLLNFFLFTKSSRPQRLRLSWLRVLTWVAITALTAAIVGLSGELLATSGAVLLVAYVGGYFLLRILGNRGCGLTRMRFNSPRSR